MKRVGLLVAVLAWCFMAGLAQAKANKAAKGGKPVRVLHGVVDSVNADGTMTVDAKGKKGAVAADVTVVTNASTVVKLDGKAAKVADITAGMKVKVTPTTGPATKIEATSKGAGKGAKAGKNAKKPAA